MTKIDNDTYILFDGSICLLEENKATILFNLRYWKGQSITIKLPKEQSFQVITELDNLMLNDMGYYIKTDSKGRPLPEIGKFARLITDGGKEVDGKTFQENLICVVDNWEFDAAGYIYDESEYERAKTSGPERPRRWLIHPKAKELSNFK